MTYFTRVAVLGVLAALLTMVGTAPVQAQDDDNIRVSEYTIEDIEYPALRDFDVPEPTRVELGNGLTVFLIEDDELPRIGATALIGAGTVYDPAEKVGLADITATVMRSGGTQSMPADSVNTVLEGLGASVETFAADEYSIASMTTLSDNIDQVLPIFAEVIRAPAFAEDKVELAKTQQKSAISRRNDDPMQIASREYSQLLYGEDSPYARTPEYYTVDAITPQDLVDFHGQYVHPNNTLISVYGNFDADEMAEKLEAAFGDWSAAEDFQPPDLPPIEGERAYSVNFIPKDDVTQSSVYIGHLGEITRNNPDYFAVRVMNEVLSGGFTSRLFKNVRTDQGLAYAVGGSYGAGYRRTDDFSAAVFTKSESTVEAAQSVMTEIEKLRSEAPTEEEVQLAKDAILNSFVFNFDTKSEIATRLMTYAYYDYPPDFLQQTQRGIEAVTPEDVLRVAEKYLHPDEVTILVLGKQADFDEPVSALTEGGTVNEVDITIPTSPPSAEGGQDASEEDQAAGRELLAQAKEALGGEAFGQIQNLRVTATQQGQTPMGEMTMDMTTLVRLSPDQYRMEMQTPMGTITMVDDGERMTMQTPQGTQQVPASMRQQVKGERWRELSYLMANLDAEGLSVQGMGTKEVDGTTYDAVKVSPPAGNAFTLHLDPETKRPQRAEYTAMTQQGPKASVAVYEDYREVAGIMLPYTTITYQEGEQTGETTVSNVEVNVDVSEDAFTLGDGASSSQ